MTSKKSTLVVPWPRRLVAGPHRDRSVHVGFVVDKVALGQVFHRVLRFPLSISLHQDSILIYHDLGEEQ
jgi:hypothetical protein